MKARYRIVTDRYAGYEVQVWRWWWPFWVMAGFCNTHSTIEQARAFAHQHARGQLRGGKVVEHVTLAEPQP